LVKLVEHVTRQVVPSVLIVQFVFLSLCLEIDPGNCRPLRILDADNLFTNRASRYLAEGIPYDWFSTDAVQERRGLLRADLVLAIQEAEAASLSAMVPERPVVLVPHVQEVSQHRAPAGQTLVFVGAKNPENAVGITRFLDKSLSAIRRHHPRVEIKIAGRVCEVLQGGWPQTQLLGLSGDLSALYKEASIVLNPVPVGTGLKIKTVEALCNGRCLVATTAGAQGLERYPDVYCRADAPIEFAVVVASLLDEPQRLRQIAERAREFSATYFSAEVILGRLESAILDTRKGP
jgi:succinoglycan biosynthesis protein ExoO